MLIVLPEISLDAIKPLVEAGFACHWLRPRSKAPFKDAWSSEPVYSLADLAASQRPGYNVGVRLGEPSCVAGHYLHVLDLDVRENAKVLEAHAALATFLPEFDTLPFVISGSGGESRHFYFLTEKPFRSRKLDHSAEKFVDPKGKEHWAWEIELFGTGKQLVLPPSVHPDTGAAYRWGRTIDFDDLALGVGPFVGEARVATWAPGAGGAETDDEDDDLAALVRAKPMGLSRAEIEACLAGLPLPDYCEDRDGWLTVGMALHHEFEGSAEGLAVWNAFSRQSAKFDERDQARVWKSFESSKRPTRMATLIKAAAGARFSAAEDYGDDVDLGAGSGDLEIDALLGDPPAWKAAPRPQTGGDVANGRTFAESHAGRLKHVGGKQGYWLQWDEMRWAPCHRGEEIEAAKDFAGDALMDATSAFRHEASAANEARLKDATALYKSAAKIHSMLDLARTESTIISTPADFDSDPWLIGVRNGVIDLRTLGLKPPHQSQMISRQAGAEFDAKATAPRFEGFLARVQPDPEVRAFLQRAAGYTLTGIVDDEKLFFLHGNGANGKSVFSNVLTALLGEFAVVVGSKLLTKSYNSSEADRLAARLPGARLALANETSAGDVWDDMRLKELAGRDALVARLLYAEPFSFFPSHKLWIRGNHLPGVQDAGDGFWRRLVSIPFNMQIPDAERIPDLDRLIIAEEMSGVLNWALRGCADWKAAGRLVIPRLLERAVNDYRDDTDILGAWIQERTVRDCDAKLRVSEAFTDYRVFCERENIRAPAKVAFGRQMSARGLCVSKSRSDGRKIPGLRLRSDFDEGRNNDNSRYPA
jgi:putative DNA primase/helicase